MMKHLLTISLTVAAAAFCTVDLIAQRSRASVSNAEVNGTFRYE